MIEAEVLEATINEYGERYQVDKAIEEMSELTQALIKYRQHGAGKDNIAEEIGDVEITLAELKIIFANAEEVKMWKRKKLERLELILESLKEYKLLELGV